ncbi:MAG: DUF559 domain-containing protein [Prevotella sp.]|nr:DUF559 domain-containing protein [Prevotella sp.]
MYIYETADDSIYEALKDMSLENRKRHTQAESIVWEYLRAKHLGHKFRRQHVIKDYIVDFVCLHSKLIIEIDGKYHYTKAQMVSDEQRTAELEALGFRMLRFDNAEVIGNTGRVLNEIKRRLMETSNQSQTARPKTSNAPASLPLEGPGEAARSHAWAVDAACSGNPGPMEYRGVDMADGRQLFHFGPMQGTNNIGEFLAIVHALALMEQLGIRDKAIYSDSYNAILWVSKKQCRTKLARTPQTEQLFRIIARAEQWLRTHPVRVPILKWETAKWGESPADFGRK